MYADRDTLDIGNAKIEGLEDSLGMTDTDYNVSKCTTEIWLIDLFCTRTVG